MFNCFLYDNIRTQFIILNIFTALSFINIYFDEILGLDANSFRGTVRITQYPAKESLENCPT